MTRRTILLIAVLLALSVPVSGQRRQEYQQLTVSSAAVMLDQTKMVGMGAGQGVLQGAEIRYLCTGSAPTSTSGTPLQVGATINFTNLIDARACQFIRTGGTDGVLNVNYWQQ